MRDVETVGGRLFGAGGGEDAEKDRRPGRLLVVFKAFVVLSLVGATVFGLMSAGLYDDALWLPVTAGVLGLLFTTLVPRGFYDGVSREGWVLISLLAVLVLVKGLSMIWTISETETIKEALRSSMYLAAFAIALAVGRRGPAPRVGAGGGPGGGAWPGLADLVLVRPAPAAPGGRRRRERLRPGRAAGRPAGGAAGRRPRPRGGRGGRVRDPAEGIPGRLRDSLHRPLQGGLDPGVPEHDGRRPRHGGAARALADDHVPQPRPAGAVRRAPAPLARHALPDALPGRHRLVRPRPRRALRAGGQPPADARQPAARLRPVRLALVADSGPRGAPERRRPHAGEGLPGARLPGRPDRGPRRRLRAPGRPTPSSSPATS